MFKECINEILKDYGQDVEIFLGNELLAKTKAFIRPLNNKSDFFKEKIKEIGNIDEGKYLYIGHENIKLNGNSEDYIFLKTENEEYVLLKSFEVSLKDEFVYIWAILSKHIKEV